MINLKVHVAIRLSSRAHKYGGKGAIILTKVVLGTVYNAKTRHEVKSCPPGHNSVRCYNTLRDWKLIQTFGSGCLQLQKRKDECCLYERCYQACILTHLLMFSRYFFLFQRIKDYLIFLGYVKCIIYMYFVNDLMSSINHDVLYFLS